MAFSPNFHNFSFSFCEYVFLNKKYFPEFNFLSISSVDISGKFNLNFIKKFFLFLLNLD